MPGFHRIRRPQKRRVSVKALVYAVAGAERARVAYRGRPGTEKYERPNHNPFAGLAPVADADNFLLENDGGDLLLETGDRLLLEAA